ncbi:MAG: hypothetical protein LCH39_08065 [Proteobacteria bacterium]|nr:hypothetical protein [Pseudomonadota bacterium]
METRSATAVPFVPQAPARVETAPVREAVRTDLNPPKAVAAQVGADQTRWQKGRPGDDPSKSDQRKSSVTTDRDTGDLVYQVLDPGTRAVLVQTPHESILKLRAYIAQTERSHERRVSEEHQQEVRAEEFAATATPKPAA